MKGRYFNKNTIELKLYEKGDKLVQFLSISNFCFCNQLQHAQSNLSRKLFTLLPDKQF